MKIFSKKSFRFDDPNNEQAPVIVQAQDFATVPDWVENSSMFQWALADGDVSTIENKTQEATAGNDDPALKELKAKAKDLGISGYTKMNADELTAAIEAASKTPGA